MGLERKDCFAYSEARGCKALTKIQCEKCNFYKSKEQAILDEVRINNLRATKEYWEAVEKIKNAPSEAESTFKGTMGERLAQWRKSKGLSQPELAKRLGYGNYVRVWEIEHSDKISKKIQLKLTEELDLPYDFFTR